MVDARQYHEQTKHTPAGVRASGFRLDPATKPQPYKRYEDLPRIRPDSDVGSPALPALTAIAQADPGSDDESAADLDLATLLTLCHYATGVTKVLDHQGQQIRYRAASCTGKLYHVDLYLVTGDCGDVGPGVYHFDPHEAGFDVLREGDYRGVLARAAGEVGPDGTSSVATAPVTVAATSTWWRNAWKYRNRTYRHAFWDSGTILANLLAVSEALGRRAEVVAGFADDPVAELLGVDPAAEAPLELVPIGGGESPPNRRRVERIDPEEAPLSPEQVAYPLVTDAWRQSTLSDGAAARAWRDRFGADPDQFGTQSVGSGELIDLDPVDAETASARPVGETIERRGSLREYSHEPISDRMLATVLDRALRGIPADCLGEDRVDRLVDAYCLVHAVDGVPSGAYQYHPEEGVLERVGDTDRRTAGHLALDQPVVGDAAVNVYLMADVGSIVEAVGNRGYRLAQLEGGIALGRLYLATYAHLALGGRGFTFYDDPVTEHLSPRAATQTPMTLFAFGKPPD